MISNCARATVAGLVAGVALSAGCHRGDLADGRFQGMIEYDQRAVSFEGAGRVVELRVRRGQAVKAAEIIARQDDALDRDSHAVDVRAAAVAQADLDLVKAGSRREDIRAAEAQLASARVTEKEAETELGRQRLLLEKGARPRAGMESVEAQVAAARAARESQEERVRALRSGARVQEIGRAAAQVAQADQVLRVSDLRIQKRTLAAPIDGVVQDVYIESGEMAAAGAPVLSIADVRRPYADVFVPVPQAPSVRVGDQALLRVEGLAGEVTGVVELVYPEAEFTPRFVFSPRERPNLVIRVRVRLADPEGRLHAGLPAYVAFAPGGARS
ncbi:MAG TPA: HlyD family efflux transporter periplasmic adaptor subunit [Polyangia bacterium]|nr:HlyD family efflux transporter periplasmic adaptor subunit [Polyangia bacterium]